MLTAVYEKPEFKFVKILGCSEIGNLYQKNRNHNLTNE
jgi:hypothetical protein